MFADRGQFEMNEVVSGDEKAKRQDCKAVEEGVKADGIPKQNHLVSLMSVAASSRENIGRK